MLYFSWPPGSDVTVSGVATEAKQDTQITILNAIDAGTPAALGQTTMAASMPVTIASNQSAVPVSGPLTDAQLRATAVPVDGSGVTQPVSAVALPLPSGAATSAKQDDSMTLIGAVTESAPASDTDSSGLNGRLQRIAQRLTSLIAQLPSALGVQAKSNSLSVAQASETLTGSAAALNGDVIASTDVSGYQTITVQLSGTWSGSVRAQFSNDNSTFTDAVYVDPTSPSTGALINMTTNGLRAFQVMGRYFRLRATSYSSGTITGTVLCSPNVTAALLQTTGTVSFTSAQSVRLNDSAGTAVNAAYGSATNALRTAAQIGNTTGAADFNSGVIGAQTLRVGLASDQLNTLATAAAQTTANASLSSIDTKTPALGQAAMAASTPVTIASNQSTLPTQAAGRSKVSIVRNDYSGASVTTAAYTELIASTSAQINKLQIFDSSGQTLKLAVGAAASEVDQIYIFPGGNGDVDLQIPAGSRVSVRAVSANAASGELVINFLN